MTGTPELSPLVVQLGWTLVHSLWQGAAIAAAYAIAHSLARERGPELRYALSIIALLLMALAPVVTFLWLDGGAPVAGADAAALALAPMLVGSEVANLDWHARLELFIEPWLPALVVVWMLGVAGMSARLWSSWRHLVALRQSAEMLDGGELKAMVILLR
jgi:bla regulator protein BlaR1